jgi:hypothetical protein
MEDNLPIKNNNDNPSNSFMGNNIGKNSFMREDEDTENPLIRDERKGPGEGRKFTRPVSKKETEANKPSFFRGRRDVTKREILWKIGQPDAYKQLWGGKSRLYKDKMLALAEKHFTKGQYEHYTPAELSKITRAIQKEVNKDEGSWKVARNDMLERIKDIIN